MKPSIAPLSNSGLSRRRFLQSAGVGAAAAMTLSASLPKVRAQTNGATLSSDATTDPLYMSTTKLAALIRAKQISAVEAVDLNIARIEAVNPKINAVVATCFERARAEAIAADAALSKGELLGPLHGVPFTIKDSFDTEGVVSTGGTLGRKYFIPSKDATVVARSRHAGAILLGKTNTPEFTLGGGGKGTVNLIHGVTRNPYNTDYQPSGSSGGAGAIVAAGGASFDIGTDFGGSIRGPAFANGIVGLKPTYGSVPRTGHIVDYGGPFDNFQEAGPLARRVEDMTLLTKIFWGPDGFDAAMVPVPFPDPLRVDLKSLRVAFYLTNGGLAPTQELQETVKQTVSYFERLGVFSITEDAPPKMQELSQVRAAFSGADDRDHMKRLLRKHGTSVASPGLRLSGDPKPTADFTRYCEEMDAIKSEQLAWFEQYDLIICPASQQAPIPLDNERGPDWTRASYTAQYNTTGWPAGVVRVGTAENGLPLGVQLVGQPWRDDVVIAAMAHVEAASGGYRRPSI